MRTIVHLDLDAFYCAVEEKLNPDLRGKCFAVGGNPQERGVVTSASYAARAFGVRSGISMRKALQLCPEMLVIAGKRQLYRRHSQHVMAILRQFSPNVEPISIDEAFIDASAISIDPRELGRLMRRRINQEVSLPCSLGMASNKLVAKIANDYGKSQYHGKGYPNAITVIAPGHEEQFLSSLPTRGLWGIGPKTAERLEQEGIKTVGDITSLESERLQKIFGRNAFSVLQRARGVDDRPVESGSMPPKSISEEHTFSRDTRDGAILRQTLEEINRRVVGRMTSEGQRATVVRIKIRWKDFTTITRQRSFSASDEEDYLRDQALHLFDDTWQNGKYVRLIGMAAAGLIPKQTQPGLWDEEVRKNQILFDTLTDLTERFGSETVILGADRLKKGSG